ncbi:MAG: T9SS type A sorting domain-containing protein [Marinilabiliaceae bacterium]|nr:T9SS type A sorting domain-containing protein [Marinilabiliaceae bacterium]
MKKNLALAIIMLLNLELTFAQFAGGNGTEFNPFQISNAVELDSVRHHLNSHFVLINDINLDTLDYQTDSGWEPIGKFTGNNATAFMGSFNGQGHVIKNLFMDRASEADYYYGLFGFIRGKIEKVGLVDFNVNAYIHVGLLVGDNAGTISSCYSTGNISGTGNVGGLVGLNNGNILNCYSLASVTNGGGLVGYNYNNKIITNCYAAGQVTGSAEGLVQDNTGVITGCYFDYEASGQSDTVTAKGVAKTTLKMMQQVTFTNWAFTSIWHIDENRSYPHLAWQLEPGNALNFDGIDDYISVSSAVIPPSGNFTVELWFNADSGISGTIELISQEANGGEDFYIGCSSTGIFRAGDDWLNTGVPFPVDGHWHHVAVTKSSTETAIYLDGIKRASITTTIVNPAGTEFRIGRQFGTRSEYFKGNIDELRVWNIERTANEIATYSTKPLLGTEEGLMAYYNFNHNTSTVLSDCSSNKNDGTLNNFALSGLSSNWIESYAMIVPTATEATNIDFQKFTANWTAPTFGTVDQYLLDVSTDSTFATFLSGYQAKAVRYDSTSIEITGLSINTDYYYRVSAVKNSITAKGAYSNIIALTTLKPDAPEITVTDTLKFIENENIKPLCDEVLLAYNQPYGSWNGGNISVQITTNASTYDHLTIDTSGLFSINGTSLFYNDTTIATLNVSGGSISSGTPLVATFNDSTTSERVQSLLEAITYQNTSENPVALKTIAISATDAYSSSGCDTTIVAIEPINDLPFRTASDTIHVIVEMPATSILRSSNISCSDPDNIDLSLTYIITRLPQHGNIRLLGGVLGLNNTFTQEQIDAGKLEYFFTGNETPVADSCIFSVTDGIDTIQNVTLQVIADALFSGGDGTPEAPFMITSVPELEWIRFFTDKCFRLMNNLDFNDPENAAIYSINGWGPIASFSGSFDGQGYEIKNIKITDEGRDYAGLFAILEGATIENLKITNALVLDNEVCGILAGKVDSSAISNCFTSGYCNAIYDAGGLIGDCYNSIITNCNTDTYVYSYDYDGSYAGGIAGYSWQTLFSKCYAIGSIESLNSGGLIGQSNSNMIDQCYTTGFLTGEWTTGGLIGTESGGSTISNSYSLTYLTSEVEPLAVIGGLIGYVDYLENTNISNCYAVVNTNEWKYSGALVGAIDILSLNVSNCYWDYQNTKIAYTYAYGGDITADSLSTEQMKQQASFNNWDFDAIWQINEGISYPYLKSINNRPFAFTDTFTVMPEDLLFDESLIHTLVSNDTDPNNSSALLTARFIETSIDTTNHELVLFYQVGTILVTDTLWGAISFASFPFVNEIEIDTYEKLKKIGVNLNYPMDGTYRLTANIDASASISENEGQGFVPIDYFSGIFHGAGHTISNLHINRPNEGDIGLFCECSNATIDSLKLFNASIIGDNCTGILAANIYESEISYCTISGSVHGNNYTGSLAGFIYDSMIDNCTSNCSVFGNEYIGGIIGQAISTNVSNSYGKGNVTGSNKVGGLVGYNILESNVSSSFATGSVSGISSVGGLIGANFSNVCIDKCYATGSVTGTNKVGGLVGYNYYNECINDCYATGSATGTDYVGGLVGGDNSSATSSCNYSSGYVTGSSNTGGLFGYCNGIMTNCYWDKNSSGQSSSDAGIGLTTSQMKSMSFNGWDFVNIWGIALGKSYPALRAINNAPFAFDGQTSSSYRFKIQRLTSNGYDYETGQTKLTAKITKLSRGSYDSIYVHFPNDAVDGDTLTAYYRIGEILASDGDTLWGNIAKTILTYNDLALSTDTIYMNRLAGDTVFTIETESGWELNCSETWLMVSDTVGLGSDSITLTLEPNNTPTSRTSVITVTGGSIPHSLVVIQEGYYLSVSENVIHIGGLENCRAYFDILSSVNWQISGDQSWLSLSNTTGSNNASIELTALETNHTGVERTAILTITSENVADTTVTVIQIAEPGNALHFDGINDYVSVSSTVIPSSGDFTVELWFRADGNVAGIRELVSLAANGGEDFYIGKSSAGVFRVGDDWVDTGIPFPVDSFWHHVAVSKSNTFTKLYLDGIERANTASIVNPAGTEFRIGRQYGSIGEFFKGGIDEIRIWNTARTSNEIAAYKNTPLLGTETGLVAYYNFNNESTDKLNNITSINYSGTLINFALSGSTSNWVESYAMVVPIVSAATQIDTSTFTMNWEAPLFGMVENYLLELATDSAFTDKVFPTVSADSDTKHINFGTFPNGTSYYFRIRANKASVAGQGAWSNIIKTTTSSPIILPVNLAVSDTTIAVGNEACFNAENEITVAGSSNVIIEEEASANFIAGYSVTFLPGFHAVEGSYVDAHITKNGEFCSFSSPESILQAEALLEKSIDIGEYNEKNKSVKRNKHFQLYPNPNNGKFSLKLNNFNICVEVMIFNLYGKIIHQATFSETDIIEFDMMNIPRGIYTVVVSDSKTVETAKMVVY